MSIFTRSTKRGTCISFTGNHANDFFNALSKHLGETLPQVSEAVGEAVKPGSAASRDTSSTELNPSQRVPNVKPEPMEPAA